MTVPVASIVEYVPSREVKPYGVALLREKLVRLGFLPQLPLLLMPVGETSFRLLDGRHRLEAAKDLGLAEVPALIRPLAADLLEEIQIARQANEATETLVPTTLVDDAELVWRLCEKFTQERVAYALGWGRTDVANYLALQHIAPEVWAVIVTTFSPPSLVLTDEAVTTNVTPVTHENGVSKKTVKKRERDLREGLALESPFTENLLRDILLLTAAQQLELCMALVNKDKSKQQFTTLAKAYRARNEALAWALAQLGALDEEYLELAAKEVGSGQYDDEWQKQKGAGPKLEKLVETIRDAWQRKHSIRLLCGDFYTLIKDVGDASIDAIIVDPPYNISTDRIYTLASQADWNKDFGPWDHATHDEFARTLAGWAQAYARIMKPGATGFMFVGEAFLNLAQSLFHAAGFEIKGTFVWCRTNPGPSVTKADFMPAIDLAIQFVKPGASRTFHYPGDDDGAGFNWQRFPICSGAERLLDAKKQTLHPTQKPEAVIWYLMELITVPGDLVFDGFMGTGTTAQVAKEHQRKFIGFEQDATYFAAAQRRVEGAA